MGPASCPVAAGTVRASSETVRPSTLPAAHAAPRVASSVGGAAPGGNARAGGGPGPERPPPATADAACMGDSDARKAVGTCAFAEQMCPPEACCCCCC